MQQTNLLLIGTVTSDSLIKKFADASINPGPAEIVQRYLIKGLCHSGVKSVTVVSAPRIPAFPKCSVKKVDEEEWSILTANIHSVGFNNFEGIGFIDRKSKIIKSTLRWADKFCDQDKTIIVYSLHSPFLEAVKKVKKKYPETTVAVVVPDLPQYMSIHRGYKKFLKKLDTMLINKQMKHIDKYVLYTKHMAEYFHLKDEQWIVLEGLMDVEKILPNEEKRKHVRPICLYAGRIDTRYAIDKLIEAFGYIPEAELQLYGNPIDAKQFEEQINKLENVRFMGTLSQDAVFNKMREADLLLNPRPTNLDLSKYSCPSKTFEYMASGTPVLMTKLPGLPEEYYPYLYFFEDESVAGFSLGIRKILQKGDAALKEKGRLAQKFLIKHKEANKQVKRIIDFII